MKSQFKTLIHAMPYNVITAMKHDSVHKLLQAPQEYHTEWESEYPENWKPQITHAAS